MNSREAFKSLTSTPRNPDEDDLEYDLHFWIGKYSTQDEYGTAAYKTVELDTFHNDKPVQHREVRSKQFKNIVFIVYNFKGPNVKSWKYD